MGKLSEALGHIERNGDLLWMPIHGHEATRLYGEMKAQGLIERNAWSGRHHLTFAGRTALEESNA